METCLLTQGLVSLTDEELLEAWPWKDRPCLVWLEEGHIVVGDIFRYIPFRESPYKAVRISSSKLDGAIAQGGSGAMTASGAMAAAKKLGIGLVVTAGMGGIRQDGNASVGDDDLAALDESGVALIATSPKDVLDVEQTIKWLLNRGVTVLGKTSRYCSGFMIEGTPVELSGLYDARGVRPRTLYLNGIPVAERLEDRSFVAKAKKAGLESEKRGSAFHPAANAMFDALSAGRSSRLQLRYFIENALWADEMTEERQS